MPSKDKYARLKSDPERYEEHKKARSEYRRRYYALHRDEELLANSSWRDANKDHISGYYISNRSRILARVASWRKDNVDMSRERKRRRRTRKSRSSGFHTEAEWQDLCSYYMDQCLCCGNVPDKLTRDHVVPLSLGGSDDISNIQPLCLSCNDSKGIKSVDYR